nr:cytoplasmic protein [Cryptococcus depauperatus CBS 7855]
MQSSDPGHLFQTDSQISQAATRERKFKAAGKIGDPINLSSKVIDLEIIGHDAWTAESGWQARRIDMRSGKTVRMYRGHQGPVTSIAIATTASNQTVLFTGSWDKTIRVWDADSGELLHTLDGHGDFVKSLTLIPCSPPVLLSTSSDRTCRVWELPMLIDGDGKPTSRQLIKEHTRPVECAVWKADMDEHGRPTGEIQVWTGDSLGVIKQWLVKDGTFTFIQDIKGHETSVTGLFVAEDGLWSASMDKTAIFHPFSKSAELIIHHPSYVKSVLPLASLPLPNAQSMVLTGSEDEDIRIWDVESSPARLVGSIQAHCGEVTALKTYRKQDGDKIQIVVVSAGLDSTLRTWTVKDILHPPELVYEPVEEKKAPALTEDEERELAELLSDED